MGRHSLEDRAAFWRSAALFVLKWVGIVVLPLLAVIGIIRLFDRGEPVETSPVVEATDFSPVPSPSPGPPEASPSPEAPLEPTPSPTPSPTATASGRLQVLNGSNTTGLGNRAAEELRKEGYTVVGVSPAARKYEKTTVFYQPGHEDMARQVARFMGSLLVEPAPSNLDRTIPVTVVVGDDYRPT